MKRKIQSAANPPRIVKLRGILKGLEFDDKLVEEAKSSLFKTVRQSSA